MKRRKGERFWKAEGQTKMGEKRVDKLSQETPPPPEGMPMGANCFNIYIKFNAHQKKSLQENQANRL